MDSFYNISLRYAIISFIFSSTMDSLYNFSQRYAIISFIFSNGLWWAVR